MPVFVLRGKTAVLSATASVSVEEYPVTMVIWSVGDEEKKTCYHGDEECALFYTTERNTAPRLTSYAVLVDMAATNVTCSNTFAVIGR